MPDDFSLGNLRIEVLPTTAKAREAARRRRQNQFVMVPLEWKIRLGGAHSVYTFKVALELLYRHWKSGGKPVLLPNVGIDGVPRGTKWRALGELESLGLITIERRPKKSPRITIILNLPVG